MSGARRDRPAKPGLEERLGVGQVAAEASRCRGRPEHRARRAPSCRRRGCTPMPSGRSFQSVPAGAADSPVRARRREPAAVNPQGLAPRDEGLDGRRPATHTSPTRGAGNGRPDVTAGTTASPFGVRATPDVVRALFALRYSSSKSSSCSASSSSSLDCLANANDRDTRGHAAHQRLGPEVAGRRRDGLVPHRQTAAVQQIHNPSLDIANTFRSRPPRAAPRVREPPEELGVHEVAHGAASHRTDRDLRSTPRRTRPNRASARRTETNVGTHAQGTQRTASRSR